MVTTIQKYVSSDGAEFATQSEAEAHEVALKTKGVVEAFITASGYKPVQAGMARNMIPAFLAFQAGQKD
jgi:hypothetical protein